MSAEFAALGIAVNALWPRTVVATAAIAMIEGVKPEQCRRPDIVADAAYLLLTQPSRQCTGRFAIDEDVLHEAGIHDFDKYAYKLGASLLPDLFLN
jgi:citronellol/citronellal dehydrogenase